MDKRITIAIIYVVLIIIFLKLVSNQIVCSIIENNDRTNNTNNNGYYVQILNVANYIQGYIGKYNYANILYKEGKYEQAIEEYEKALTYKVPKKKECKIRINYALAICKTVIVDERDDKSIKNAIEKYEYAINVLTEKGCANKDDNNGHNKEAEQLKKDIQNEIDRLKKLLENNNNKNENNENSNNSQTKEEKEKEEKKSEEIEKELQNIKDNAIEKQREKERNLINYNKNSKKEYNDKNW